MKRTLFYLLPVCLISFYSCRKAYKNVDDYYPMVKMVSTEVNAQGEVIVTGEVLSTGAAELEAAGFCMDTVGNPVMLENQKLSTELNGANFSATYKGLNPKKKYFFRCYASNDFGYKYGDVMVLDGLQVPVTAAPCNPTANKYSIGLAGVGDDFVQVTSATQTSSGWNIVAYGETGNFDVTLIFSSKPVTKVYNTASYYTPAEGQVTVSLDFGFSSGLLLANQKVYVNEVSSGQYEITICDALWNYGSSGSNYSMTTKIVSPF